ncbi:MarC family NAAT transporter [Alcaligenes faecalis]|uniref:MarC family NAAT transporter n=1 Tax=Alcaligenes faecalis TaxID=511 RepID=UPI000F0B296D|nr:MarC family NAAT transporter [Alcaligenes faecalis]AYR18922.1 MarC family NAAT transporter [Alcaligenes faecalis]
MPNELMQLFKLIGLGLAFLLPMANPLTSMVMYLSLGETLSAQEKKQQLHQATLYVILALLITYYAGLWITSALGISMVDMRIAGGLIVAYIGFRMLFPPSVSEVVSKATDQNTAAHDNIAFVPLTLPSTVGPGTMALVISASSKMAGMHEHYAQWVLVATPLILALLIGLIFFICLRSSLSIVRVIGHNGVDAISRIMGFLLVCMAVQLVLEGGQQYAATLLTHSAAS